MSAEAEIERLQRERFMEVAALVTAAGGEIKIHRDDLLNLHDIELTRYEDLENDAIRYRVRVVK